MVKKLKSEKAATVDVDLAVKELKARKIILEQKVFFIILILLVMIVKTSKPPSQKLRYVFKVSKIAIEQCLLKYCLMFFTEFEQVC